MNVVWAGFEGYDRTAMGAVVISGGRGLDWSVRRGALRRLLAAVAVLCSIACAAPARAPARAAHRHGGPHHGGHRRSPRSHAASRYVKEWGSLKLNGSKGATIKERGYGWGSFHCAVYITLTVSGTHVRGRYVAYPKGGAIRGYANARIRSATTKLARFTGTIVLHGGSGRYARSAGRASFDGTIDRHSYAMKLRIAGKVRL